MQSDLLSSAASAFSPQLSTVLGAPSTAGAPSASGAAVGNAPFSGVFAEAMNNLQGLEEQAASAVEGVVKGRGVDIHAAMIATQKSDLAFEMALAVRGKLVSAYQATMGVQF